MVGIIEVSFGSDTAKPDRRPYQQAVGLCEKGRFAEAKAILEVLAKDQPANSEAHRLLGQVCHELGDNEAAIDHLIDALRSRSLFLFLLAVDQAHRCMSTSNTRFSPPLAALRK